LNSVAAVLDKEAAHCGRREHGSIERLSMKPLISISSLVVAGLWSAILPANAQVNVTQHHNHASRDGLYIDPAFTHSAAASLTRDLGFNGTIVGNVYAQPLYIEGGPDGRAKVIAVTESNNVYAFDAADGTVIWQRHVGAPVSSSFLPCGNINPLGITGTPIVDLGSRALFLDAMTTPDGGTTKKHLIFSLNVDTGVTNPGWPVDVNASAVFNQIHFTSAVQNERSALGLVNGVIYVPYSGHEGDCGMYHGWVVGVPINNPASVTAWATDAIGGGIWAVGGVASDGANPFIASGNTFNTGGTWSGGEAVIRFQPGPIFSGNPADYWVPTNWFQLDGGDTDLGGSGPLLVDVPGATPSSLVVQLGKDGNAYLLNRSNLGGITAPVASSQVSGNAIIQAAATYRTNQGTYVVFRANGSLLSAFRITATNPPAITSAWSVSRNGCGSPFVTSTDGTNNMIVWVVGTGGDQRLHGYDGDTGNVVYAGGGANELMTGTHSYSTTGIAARGRIYIGTDNKVYAFAVPGGTPTPTPTPTPTATPTPTPTPTPGAITMVWYLNNNVFIGSASGPTLPAGWQVVGVADFNRDGHPDHLLYNAATRRTVVWYMNNNIHVASHNGPTLPSGWSVVSVADFNGDGHPDYLLFNPATHKTVIWYLVGTTFLAANHGPTLPSGWQVVATSDFNGNGRPDLVLYRPSTQQTAIWYMNNNVHVGGATGPTLPGGWSLVATADFNRDGHPDYLLFKANTRQTVVWYMNNNVHIGGASGPTLRVGWSLAGVADFNRDGHPDYLLFNASL
jgi:outer membrane protein assembly factor BamB